MPERELRCKGNKLHGLVVSEFAEGMIEFRCNSRFCGKEPGVIVLHRFDLGTGDVETRRYSDPAKLATGGESGSTEPGTAVRTA
jgi:hypothetical protein